MEELTDNAEEHDEEGSKQSEQKLGKLQYKVCDVASVKQSIFLIELIAPHSWNTISIPIV